MHPNHYLLPCESSPFQITLCAAVLPRASGEQGGDRRACGGDEPGVSVYKPNSGLARPALAAGLPAC